MAWVESPDALSCFAVSPFENQLADHADESGVRANGAGADHVQSEFGTHVFGFGVEVELDFHVVRNESDRRDDYVGESAFLSYFAQVVADIRLQPRLCRRTAAALVDETPCLLGKVFRDQPT